MLFCFDTAGWSSIPTVLITAVISIISFMKRVVKLTLEIRTDSEKGKPASSASRKKSRNGIIELIKAYALKIKGL